jgi:hypothetical protein
MSAFARFADSSRTSPEVREVPIATERSAQNPCLFDQFVGGYEQLVPHSQAKRLAARKYHALRA